MLLCIHCRISTVSIAPISKAIQRKNQSRAANRYRPLLPTRPKRLVDHGTTSKSKRSAASDTRSSSSSLFKDPNYSQLSNSPSTSQLIYAAWLPLEMVGQGTNRNDLNSSLYFRRVVGP